MNISRSPLDNLRHQTLVINAMRILQDWLTYWNEWWTKLLFATFFSTRSKTPTNKTNWNGRKRSQTRTYKLHNDERRKQTHWKEFYSGPIRKYTLVDVGGYSSVWEEAINTNCHLTYTFIFVSFVSIKLVHVVTKTTEATWPHIMYCYDIPSRFSVSLTYYQPNNTVITCNALTLKSLVIVQSLIIFTIM